MVARRRFGRRKLLGAVGGGIALVALGGFGAAAAGFASGQARAEEAWEAGKGQELAEIGTVRRLSILPLVDWYPSREELVGEPGLSYLIRADETAILVDVGFNSAQEHPSPLLRNASALGVDLAGLDAIFISHPHNDHIGGRAGSINLSAKPVALPSIPTFTPVELASPTGSVVVTSEPTRFSRGIASIGVIPSQDFVSGWTPEQSLAVNVEGKGIVLVVGCGHPTVGRIVERAEQLFDAPIYGIVGGLHFPVTDSRAKMLGVPAQKVIGTGKWPWDPIGETAVAAAIDRLKRLRLGLIALSAHDSCDWSLGEFRQAFGSAYRDVQVGREIVV